MILHILWAIKGIPVVPGVMDMVIMLLKMKIAAGADKPSDSSYRCSWFCILKKDRVSLQLVLDLQPLNAITIKNAGTPELTDRKSVV